MESVKVRESLRQTKLKSEEIQLFNNSFVIVPYQVSGFLDYSNRGIMSEVVSPNDFETFKRIWTGNDACVISWKNSFHLRQNKDTKELEQHYQLGEVFLGLLETNNFENEILKDKSFSEYTSQQQTNTITFRVDKYFKIDDYYNFMFYKIPELSGSTLYRIESIEKDFLGIDLIGYVITFKTINQDLANTGKARQQNIMPCAPGQGYLECVVKDKNWPNEIGKEQFDKLVNGKDFYFLFDRYITSDFLKAKNNPVKKVIVKALGNGIINSFSMTGRPASFNNMEFGASRKLFCKNFTTPLTPTLFRSQSSIQNYYASNFKMTLQYYKEFFTYLKDTISNINKFNYQGWLEFDSNIYSTNSQTSPLFSDWFINKNVQQIDDLYTPGTMTTYTTKQIRNIDNYFFDNYWITKNVKIAPLNQLSSLNYGTTIFGGMALSLMSAFNGNLLGFCGGLALSIVGIVGLDRTLQQQSKFKGIEGIVPKDIIDFNKGLYAKDDRVPFNLFDNDSDNEGASEIFFKSNTINMCFEANITDTFSSDRVPNRKLTTINIGQDKFQDGTNILPNGETFLLNGDAILEDSETNGFIIDSFQFCGIFNGELSVEFLDSNGDVCWSGVYQSEAKWTKNQREIWTEKNVSIYGRENIFINEPIKYPKPIKNSFDVSTKPNANIRQQIGGDVYQNAHKDYFDLRELKYCKGDIWNDSLFFHYKTHFRYCFNQFATTPKQFLMNTNIEMKDIKTKFNRIKISIEQDFITKNYHISHSDSTNDVNQTHELWSQTFNLNDIKKEQDISLNLNIQNFSKKLKSEKFAWFMNYEIWSTLPYNYLTFRFKYSSDKDFLNILFNGSVTKLQDINWNESPRTFTLYGTNTTYFHDLGDYYKSELLRNGILDTRIYLKVEFL